MITMAWSERYIDDLIEITILTLLAAGNQPAFAAELIVTETQLFDRIVPCGL